MKRRKLKVREMRRKQGLTMKQVAEKVGVSEVMICQIENGNRKPSVRTAQGIANVLGFDWTDFFREGA